MRDKAVLVFTPHPDGELFGAGGTIALLSRNGNKVLTVIYTNDDKGSHDQEMTSESMARLRKGEEETAQAVLGTPKESISWMGYHDGLLEHAPQLKLVEETAAIIRRARPDVLLSIDSGESRQPPSMRASLSHQSTGAEPTGTPEHWKMQRPR